MLASGVAAGIIAGVAFGGDWRRLATFNLRLWPVLVLAVGLRFVGDFVIPNSPLGLYLVSLLGVSIVAGWNWRVPGALLIAAGTSLNLLVAALNSGMPYDPAAVAVASAPPPNDGLHVLLAADTRLVFLSDVIPVAAIHNVLSLGDFLNAVGGFLIPFMWLQPPAQANAAQTLRSPNFALFWSAQVVSRFGDPITLIALTYVTYKATQSALATALAVLIATIPNALFSFFGGAIADAAGHRRVMLRADVVRAVVLGVVPLLIGLNSPLVFVFAAVFVSGMCSAIFNPARISLIPTLLSKEHLARGNSLVYATDRAVEIAGGLAGGILVATIGSSAFFVDAATFALSAMLLSRVAVVERGRPLTWSQLLEEARGGLMVLRRSSVLWANTIFSLAAQVSNPIINGLTPAFVIQRFAGNDPAVGAVEYGISEAAIAAGAVVASALLPRYANRLRKGKLLVIGFLATGVLIVLIALSYSFPVTVALFAMLGIANVAFYVPTVTLLQEKTAPETRASVFGARIALTNLSWLPVIFVGGALADIFGPALLIGLAGVATFIAALIGSRVRAVFEVA
jgi:MFS family permease